MLDVRVCSRCLHPTLCSAYKEYVQTVNQGFHLYAKDFLICIVRISSQNKIDFGLQVFKGLGFIDVADMPLK